MSASPGSAAATFPVRLEFMSDWHVGTGEGRVGVVDALVRRDGDKLPFVPAKTVIGVWRDACETVARTLDGAAGTGAWAAWVDWLFGSQPAETRDVTARREKAPAAAALSLTPARLADGLRHALHGNQALIDAAVLLRPGVQLDITTGTAQDDMLRLEERALAGLVLHATGTVHGVDELPPQAELLLRAGARFVEALGGKRNRGAGRLVLHLDGSPEGNDRLAGLMADDELLEGPGDPPDSPGPNAPLLADGRRAGPPRRWRLELETLSPVVIVDRVVGNNITTRSEVPGTALLPPVLAALPDPAAVGLDDVRVGDAVPAVVGADGTARPAFTEPTVWHRNDKGEASAVVNAALRPLDLAQRPKPGRTRVARLADVAGEPAWRQCRPGVGVSTHAVVDDAARRPTGEAGGGLFSYHGIEAGTVLVSDLVLPTGVELTIGEGDTLRLGRSRKDDFGRVRVRRLAPLDEPSGTPARPVGSDGTLRVWLVSDVLLRDERLAFDPSPERLARVLGTALEVPLDVVEHDPELRSTMTQPVRRDGFAPRWGRPRRSLVGLQAGSVVTFTITNGSVPDPAKVTQVERDGIGDRTVEGFGRVLVDPLELRTSTPAVLKPSRPDDPDRPPAATPPSSDLLPDVDATTPHPIELSAWRREIRRKVAAIAADPDRQQRALPALQRTSRSQRGVLRTQVDRLTLPRGRELVEGWFASLSISATRRGSWDSVTIAQLRKLLLDGGVWAVLGLDGAEATGLVLIPGRERLLREALQREALAVLIDELVRQSHADEESPDLEEVRP